MSAPFVKAAPAYYRKGQSPIPIVAGEKRPCVNWGEYTNRSPNVHELLTWANAFPNAGVGIVMGKLIDGNRDLRMVALDVDDDQFVEPVRKLLFSGTNAGALRIAKKGHRGETFFALSQGLLPGQKLKTSSGMAVELLSLGQQTVVPPTIHPITGKPYAWTSEHTLLDSDAKRLPVITQELWLEIRAAVTPIYPRPATASHPEWLPEAHLSNSETIRYLGDGQFEGVSMTYPGDVNVTCFKMAGAAARYNLRRDNLDEHSRQRAIEAIVEHAFKALRRSGSSEKWSVEAQWQEAASQYDRQMERLREQSTVSNDNHGEAERAVVQGGPARASRLNLIRPAAFQDVLVPQRDWLVDGWIPYGQVAALYGDGGIGKSLAAQQLMTCCALGLSWFGLRTKRCKAFGLFCEDDPNELWRRQDAINRHYGVQFRDLNPLVWISRVAEDNILMRFVGEGSGSHTRFWRDLRDEIANEKPGLIVIDTAADTYGGNENNRGQVLQFISAGLGGLAKAVGATLLLLAHPSRNGLQTGSGDGGSTAWNNSVRARLYLQRTDSAGATQGLGDRVLSRKKSNYGPVDGEAIPLAWKDGAFVPMGSSDAVSALLARAKWQEVFLAAFDELSAHEPWLSPSVNSSKYAPRKMMQLPAAQNLTEAQLKAAMGDLVASGTLRVVEDGPPSKRHQKLVRSRPPEMELEVQQE
jgi:hypothetical protein